MRTFAAVLLGLVGGFILGIILSEIIGIIGFVVFHHIAGIKYLALFVAIAGAIVAPLVDSRIRRAAHR